MHSKHVALISFVGAIMIISTFHLLNHHLQHQQFSNFVLQVQKTPSEKAPSPTVHIVVLADMNAKEKYKFQLETIHCYARAHGFDFLVPTKDEMIKTQCVEKTFFLQRHCVLSRTMATFPDGHLFVLLDGDTIAFNLTRKFPLEEYLSHDLVFYERWWNGEVMIALGLRNKVRNELFESFYLCCTQHKLFFQG